MDHRIGTNLNCHWISRHSHSLIACRTTAFPSTAHRYGSPDFNPHDPQDTDHTLVKQTERESCTDLDPIEALEVRCTLHAGTKQIELVGTFVGTRCFLMVYLIVTC